MMNASESPQRLGGRTGTACQRSVHLDSPPSEAETGMLASWVQQCSFEPPQLSVALKPGREISGWLMPEAGFTLNILDDTQSDMIAHFGKGFKSGESAFNGLEVEHLERSGPVLREALAFLECRVTARHSAGDHDLIIGQVVARRDAGRRPTDDPRAQKRHALLSGQP